MIKQKKGCPWYEWIKKVWPQLIILIIPIIRASIFQRRRATDEYTSVDTNNIIDLVAIVLMFLLLLKGSSFFYRIMMKSPAKHFIWYYILCFFSFIWASGQPIYIMYRAFEMLVTFLTVGYIIYSLKSYKDSLYFILFISSLCTLCGILKVFINTGGSFNITFYHTNTFTISALIGCLIGIGMVQTKTVNIKDIYGYIIICGIGLIIGTSSASYISFIIGWVLLISTRNNNINYFKIIGMCGIGYILFFLWGDIIIKYIFPNKDMKNIETGTGRVDMWAYYIDGWLKRPILGYGFAIGEKNGQIFGWVQTSSSHNVFISILVNTGLLGFSLFTAFLIDITHQMLLFIKKGSQYAAYIFSTFIAIIINCNSFPALGSHWSYVTPPILALIAFCSFYINEKIKIKWILP